VLDQGLAEVGSRRRLVHYRQGPGAWEAGEQPSLCGACGLLAIVLRDFAARLRFIRAHDPVLLEGPAHRVREPGLQLCLGLDVQPHQEGLAAPVPAKDFNPPP